MATGSPGAPKGPLKSFGAIASQSLMETLAADPEWEEHTPNRTSRQVRSGHYVPVLPTPLPEPKLLAVTRSFANGFGIGEEAIQSDEFARFFSGHMDACPPFKSWCTPYALSIYGQELYQNCPFKNGNGYGDGRAISIAEVLVPEGTDIDGTGRRRWEFQLKGAGKTPFCRGADGRAVVRSSVREFLVSEAMHNMDVSTTRALSLVASQRETVDRPWYKEGSAEDRERELAQYPPQLRAMVLARMRDPNVMNTEYCAITCRVAPSFLRVGQVELFGRRARKGTPEGMEQLRAIVEHVMKREYGDVADVSDESKPFEDRVLHLLNAFSIRLAKLTADWIRVGYCQGNFNSDNCLVGGRTMDYGPFGFIEKFEPLWNMWVGGGEHFGFLNQHVAGLENYKSFVSAVRPILAAKSDEYALKADKMSQKHEERCWAALGEFVWRPKLGMAKWDPKANKVVGKLFNIMQSAEGDYTIVWRQLADVAELPASSSDDDLLRPLANAFYTPLKDTMRVELVDWIRDWKKLIGDDTSAAAARMRAASPKYVPREWMLKNAYTRAQHGDMSEVERLQKLFERPYDDQPEMEQNYYQKAPTAAFQTGGVAFMS